MVLVPHMATAMTIRPGTTRPAGARRALWTALTAIVLTVVSGYETTASVAIQKVELAWPDALLASLRSKPSHALDTLSVETLRTALAASPLEQATVNVGMAREARDRANARNPAWLALLSQMGWRDTHALQNMLYAAALSSDLPRILDITDALLRRQQLMEQIIPMLTTVSADPELQTMLVARLATNPSWRAAYLTSTTALRDRDALLSRFAVVQRLLRSGVHLDRGEVIANINALNGGGLPAYGFSLWESIRGLASRPLDDTNFALASHNNSNDIPVPYQWQMLSGDAFRADASQDGGHPQLSINWDGRGIPVFAQQRTSAGPGRYALALVAEPRDAGALSAVVFRLMCGGTATAFRPVAPLHYVTEASVSCGYPTLQIAGDIQPSVTPREFAIDRITMTPLASGER